MEFRRGDIVFEGVTAGYAGREVLRDFSCRLRQGGRYAIVGASGAGKSTLVRALMGTARVSAGRITLGGVDVGRIPLSELYRHVLYVPQTTFVFEGTVRDNIGLFSGEPGVEEAARRAALPDSLARRPRRRGQRRLALRRRADAHRRGQGPVFKIGGTHL